MLRSPALSTRHKAVKTYGRTSRPKASAFRVFQDAINQDEAPKKSQPAIPSSPPIIGKKDSGSISDIDLAEDLDPLADPLSLPSIDHRTGSGPGRLPVSRLNPATFSPKAIALKEKSTNQPILIRSPTSTRETSEPHTASLFRPSLKNHRKKKQKFTNTPRVIHGAKTPLRPRKSRYPEPTDEERDFIATQSPTKIRGYISQEEESDGTDSGGATLLGTQDIDMIDSATSVTWVRERARDIFSGTRKAAGKILGVGSANTKCKDQKEGRSRKVSYKEDLDFRANIFKEHKDSASLHNPPQEPPANHQNKASRSDGPLGLHRTIDPSRQKNFGRLDNNQDLFVPGSSRMQYTKKRRHSTEYPICDENPNSFRTSVAIRTPQGSIYDISDNEVLLSSPLLKSAPKKEQYHSRLDKFPFYNDADSCEGVDMEESLDKEPSDESDGDIDGAVKNDKDKLLGNGTKYREKAKRYTENKHLILRAASSEDEFYQISNETEMFGKGSARRDENIVRRGVGGSSYKKNSKAMNTASATTTIDDGTHTRGRKHSKEIVHVGGSRTSTYMVPKDPKVKGPVGGAGKKSNGKTPDRSSQARISLKKKPNGKIGKGGANKETRKQKSTRGYEKLEGDDIDELQMDLPSMMI